MPAHQEALRHAVDCARELLDVLDAEHRALLARDMERIAETASRKELLTRQLNDLSVHGSAPAGESGEPPSPLWKEFTDLMTRCRHENRKNGAVIEAARRHTQRAMDLLSGRAAGGAIYGAGGEARTLSASRYATRA